MSRSFAFVFGFALVAAAAACNSIAGNGDYTIVDDDAGGMQPNGQTPDGHAAGPGQGPDDASAPDVSADGRPTCSNGLIPVVVTVTATTATDSVGSNPPGINVAANTTGGACLVENTYVFRTSGGSLATWSGASCKDGNVGRDRCEADVAAGGLTLGAALP